MAIHRLWLCAWLVSTPTWAAIYENAVAVDDEETLFDLQQRQDVSTATVETLLELMREGVDINLATREQLSDVPGLQLQDVEAILTHRHAHGPFNSLEQLVEAQLLSSEQLQQLRPFLKLSSAGDFLIRGRARLVSRFTATDNVAPPVLLSARLAGPAQLSAGVMLATTRLLASPPHYDATRDALQVQGIHYSVHLPRFFVQWAPGKAKILLGTYTVGFAERLTLDTSRRVTPNGMYLTDDFQRPLDLARPCRVSNVRGLFDASQAASCSESVDEAVPYVTSDFNCRRGVSGSSSRLSRRAPDASGWPS